MAQSTEQTEALAALYRFGNAVAGVCGAAVMQQGALLARGAQGAQGRAAATQEQARRLRCRRAPHCSHDCWWAAPPNGTIPAETPIRRVTAVGGNVGGVAVAHLSQRGGYERLCDVCRSAKGR